MLKVEELELLNDLRWLYREKERLKEAVRQWLIGQAREGHVRCNGDAPAWFAYEEAETALYEALKRLGEK